MRGFFVPQTEDWGEDEGNLAPWESLVVHAVGAVIEFWGFKRNQGRLWGLLFLRDRPMDAATLREDLSLSKGAVSMILRELEGWGIIQRVRVAGSQSWHFVAEKDFMSMISRVIKDREVLVVSRVKEDLLEAEKLAQDDPTATEAIRTRIKRMRQLAEIMEQALLLFLKTANLELADMRDILKENKS